MILLLPETVPERLFFVAAIGPIRWMAALAGDVAGWIYSTM